MVEKKNKIVKSLTINEFQKLQINKSLPLWGKVLTTSVYPCVDYLVISHGNDLKAIWAVPINDEGTAVERICRILPYHSPIIMSQNNLKRRSYLSILFSYLTEKYKKISLPFDPDYTDLAILAAHKAFIEWRHTHVADSDWLALELPSKVKNHYYHAIRNVKIRQISVDKFCFDKAIVNQDHRSMKLRKRLASLVFKRKMAFCLRAEKEGIAHGEIFIAMDERRAYLLHSWFERRGIRGVPTALIISAIKNALEKYRRMEFDIEGSVIPSVDKFFSSFNFKIVPYAHVHWNNNSVKLQKQLAVEIFSDERLL